MNMNFNFNNPTNLVFGSGSLNVLGKEISVRRENGSLGKKALLLVSNGKSSKINGAYDRVMEQLGTAGVEVAVFDKIMENPLKSVIMEGAAFAKENSCVFTSNPDTNEKIGFGYPELVPVLAITDPELMKTVSPKYTAYQGFDALFHNTEVMISNGVNILSETIALSAIESIARYLPRAVKDGNDLEAREHVAYGSTIAGITMQLTSTTAQHSMEHAMSAYHHNLPHGAGLIMISKAFAEFFIEKHACDGQFIKMAKAMGIPGADKPEDFITALVKLQKDCGVDNLKMSDYGFKPEESMTLAVNARETMGGLFLVNPCDMSDEECAGIFDKSYK